MRKPADEYWGEDILPTGPQVQSGKPPTAAEFWGEPGLASQVAHEQAVDVFAPPPRVISARPEVKIVHVEKPAPEPVQELPETSGQKYDISTIF